VIAPHGRERGRGPRGGGKQRRSEQQRRRRLHPSLACAWAKPATGARKASRLPARGWAASAAASRFLRAVVTKAVRKSSPPKAILVILAVGIFTVPTRSPAGEKRATHQPA